VNGQESQLVWHKSSRSNGQANCVETAVLPDGGRAVRDSKDHGVGPVLTFTKSEWEAFVGGVRDGEFD
jgi:hypothetical protein